MALSSWYTVGKHITKLKAGTFNPDRGDRGPGLLFPEVAWESMTLSLSQDRSVLNDLEQTNHLGMRSLEEPTSSLLRESY